MPEFILDTGSPDGARTFSTLDPFTRGYVEALFFTSTGTGDDGELEHATFAELADEALEQIAIDCRRFQLDNTALLQIAYAMRSDYDATCAGRDLWFTRCGHGVGFWDRDLGSIGDKLADAARKYGSRDLYRGDDGSLYLA